MDNNTSETPRAIIILVRIDHVLSKREPGPYALCNEIAMNNLDLLISGLENHGHKVLVVLNSDVLVACKDIDSYKEEFPRSLFVKRLKHVIQTDETPDQPSSFLSLAANYLCQDPNNTGYGFVAICSAKDFPEKRTSMYNNTVAVAEGELFGSSEITTATAIARFGDPVFRLKEIDYTSMHERSDKIRLLEACLYAANQAVSSMNVVGKNVEFKSENELLSDAKGFESSEKFYQDSITSAKVQWERVFGSIEKAHSVEIERISKWKEEYNKK